MLLLAKIAVSKGRFISALVTIGDNVFIAPGVIFTNDRYPPSGKLIKTVIEDNVTIGAGSVIGPGLR